ncbi:MAG: NUDIX domain-containing protein [archaeon]|nr:NUDIX domain-containing protein [archaeon]
MEIVREFLSTVFVVKDGKVLMTWNNKVNNWIPIGGHIEPNELPCSSAIREAKEESGLDIEVISPFDYSKTANLVQPVHVHLDHIKEDHKHINLIYFGIVKGGECFKIDDEGKELRWFTKEELEQEDLIPSVKKWAIESLKQLGDNY